MKKILLLLFVLAAQFSFATTYYVATNGSDNNLGTSISSPFLTIAKALTKAINAGDVIYVRSGTYTFSARLNITKSGTSALPILLSAYPPDITTAFPADGRPVLDFSSLAVGSSSQGIQAKNVSNFNVYGLKIKGAGDNGMLIDNCNYMKIEFSDFFRNRDAGFQIRNLSHHCLILNCDAYENADMGTGTTTQGGNADGFAPKLDVGDSVIFRGCRAWLNSDDGWDGYLKATESGIPDGMTTILENCWTWRNGYYWLDGTTTTAMNGNGFKTGGSANKDQAHNFIIVRCLSFYNKAKGFDQNNNAGSISLYNCTANKNGDLDYGLNSSGVTYAAGSLFTVKNCNSLGTKGTSFKTGTVKSNNSFSTATTSTNYTSIDTTGISAQRKIDGSLPDINYMHLVQGSTLIDGGIALPTVSYYGTLGVPYYGNSPDIGCFESNYPLPLKFINYELQVTSNSTSISLSSNEKIIEHRWQTVNEINVSHYNVERSNNARDFTVVGKINAANKTTNTYSFTDLIKNTELENKDWYYRIVGVDVDGKQTYSETKKVTINDKSQTIQIFPNPSKNTIHIISTQEIKDVKLFNYLGKQITVTNNLSNGNTSCFINISSCGKGFYILQVINVNGDVNNQRIIIE